MSKIPILKSSEVFDNNKDFFIHKSSDKYIHFMELPHKHDFIEISYVVSGTCEHIQEGKSIIAKKGDIFLLNYGVVHADRLTLKSNEPFISYDVAFKPGFLDSSLINESDILKIQSSYLFNSLFTEGKNLEKIKLTGNGFFEFESIFKKMLTEFTDKKQGYYDLLRAYTIELLVKLFRQLNFGELSYEGNRQSQYINLAIQYIENNYMQKLQLEDIAYRSYFSKSYFSQLFKKQTGYTFTEYLQNTRIENACILLREDNDSIAAICEKVGFNDLKFFYTVFKRHTDYTPKEYRLLHSGKQSPDSSADAAL